MNIFVLDEDPRLAAEAQCDQHVVKMTLETAQLLCAAFPEGAAPYRRSHYNHPCAVWARTSANNFLWLWEHGVWLANEYEHRFGKEHKSLSVIRWCLDNFEHSDVPACGDLTAFAQAMPEQYRRDNPVSAYRAYYLGAKRDFARWNNGRAAPGWWEERS